MTTITKEQVHAVSDLKAGYTLGHADVAILQRLARIALASLEAEPVGFRSKLQPPSAIGSEHWDYTDHRQPDAFELENCVIERLYTAPPAPVSVPTFEEWCKRTEQKPVGWVHDAMKEAYDACRAAMLQGDNERHVVRSEHAEWSQSTFGDVGPVGPLKHLSKEALEAATEPGDLSEWADMQFLLWDAQRRAGITDEQITLAMIEKLEVNKARTWPEPKDGEPRLHIKAEPQQEVNP